MDEKEWEDLIDLEKSSFELGKSEGMANAIRSSENSIANSLGIEQGYKIGLDISIIFGSCKRYLENEAKTERSQLLTKSCDEIIQKISDFPTKVNLSTSNQTYTILAYLIFNTCRIILP